MKERGGEEGWRREGEGKCCECGVCEYNCRLPCKLSPAPLHQQVCCVFRAGRYEVMHLFSARFLRYHCPKSLVIGMTTTRRHRDTEVRTGRRAGGRQRVP